MATSPRRWAGVLGLVLAACGAPAEQPPPDAAPPIDTPPPPPDGDLDGVADADDCAPGDDTRWRTLSLFAEVDNDGVGAGGPSLQCIGATLPPMTSQLGTDCGRRSGPLAAAAVRVRRRRRRDDRRDRQRVQRRHAAAAVADHRGRAGLRRR